jgi:zinc D-Ala-D-Ala carboxypeptidase
MHPRTAPPIRVRRLRVALLLGLLALIAVAAGRLPSSSSTATASTPTLDMAPLTAEHQRPGRPLGVADGQIPDGTTVFSSDVPGVAKLDPALLSALRAAADASGVPFTVDSGWRSKAYQRGLLDAAVAQYGSAAEAARWVATPKTSAHVHGDAVDLGSAAAAWLAANGAAYGLCQIYANETWHFELRPDARVQGCPPMYADPTHDPRMQS